MINSTLSCLIFSLIKAGKRAVDLSTRLKVQQATQRTDNRTAEQPTDKICTAAHKPIGDLYLMPYLIRRRHILGHANIIIGNALIGLIQVRNVLLSHGSHHHISHPRLIC